MGTFTRLKPLKFLDIWLGKERNMDGYEQAQLILLDGYERDCPSRNDGYGSSDPEIIISAIREIDRETELQTQVVGIIKRWFADGYAPIEFRSVLDGYIKELKGYKEKSFMYESWAHEEPPIISEKEQKERDAKIAENARLRQWAALAKSLSVFPATSPKIFAGATEIAKFVNAGKFLESEIDWLTEYGIAIDVINYYKSNAIELKNFCGIPMGGVSTLDLLLNCDKEQYGFEGWGDHYRKYFPEFSKIAEKFEKNRCKKYKITQSEMGSVVRKISRKDLPDVSLPEIVDKYVKDICIDKSKASKLALKKRLIETFCKLLPKSTNVPTKMAPANDVSEVEAYFYYYISELDNRFEKEIAKRTIIGRVSRFFRKLFKSVKGIFSWKKNNKKKKKIPKLETPMFRRL